MLRRSSCAVVVALSALGCSPGVPGSLPGQGALSTEALRTVSRAVFEVVVPAPDDGTTTYKIPLPFDLLPLSIRNQKFVPVGTAFALSSTQFVTAAHVLLAMPGSSFYLRDPAGATYEVSRILRFSEYRDIAVFDLVRPPPDVAPLEERASVAVGEAVLTVGNAGGQGVVVRGGVVTSFTPEEVDGQWRFVRFTAPASPGNSGGPLVDAAGRVVGIVVRKNPAENLNYAIPIDELRRLRTNEGDLSQRGLTIQEDYHQIRVDWAFRPPLPSSLGELKRAAQRSYAESMTRWYAELDSKFGSVGFPDDPRLKTFLVNPDVPTGLGHFGADGNGEWGVAHTAKFTQSEVTPGQRAQFFDCPDKNCGELLIERPKGMPLATWFESPEPLATAVVRNYSWTLPFAGRSIGIESLGAPADSERWKDEYGRPWFTYVWRLNRTGESVVFNCLTNPAGWACTWRRFPSGYEDVMRLGAKRDARRVTLSYYGLVRDWVEFLALPDAYKPEILKGASARFDDGLTVSLGPMVGEHIVLPSLSPESSLYAHVSLDPGAPHAQRIYQTIVNPRIVNTYAFGVREVFAPTPERPAIEAALWAKLQAGSAPFDDAPAVEVKTMNAIKRGIRPAGETGRDRMDLEFCRNPVDESKTELQAACAKFQSALRTGARR